MQEFALIYLAIILLIILIYTKIIKDVFNPVLVFFVPLIVNYNIYYFVFSKDYTISNLTVNAFLYGITAYLIGYAIMMMGRFRNQVLNHSMDKASTKLKVNNNLRKLLTFIGIVGFLVGVYEFLYFGFSGQGGFLTNVRYNYMYGEGVSNISKYGSMILFIITCIYTYQYKEGLTKKWNKLVLISLISFSIFSAFFAVARTTVLHYSIALIYIFVYFDIHKIVRVLRTRFRNRNLRKTYTKVMLFIIIILAFFIYIAELTGKIGADSIFSKDFFLYKYLGFSLIAFDTYIKDYPATSNGYFVLGPIGKILLKLNFINKNFVVDFGAPKGVFNVYSFFSAPYRDFGLVGVLIVMFIIGCIIAVIYNKSRNRGGMWTIFYANYLYAIVMAFYAYQFSNTFYLYLILILLILSLTNRKKYRGEKK